MEKITFIYPTRILPGMIANTINTPDIVTYVSDIDQAISLYLYTGLVLEKDLDYSVEIDVFSQGESILPKDEFISDTQVFSQYINNSNDFINLSYSWLPGLKIIHEGMLEIQVKLLKGVPSEINKTQLDVMSCFLLVRKERDKES